MVSIAGCASAPLYRVHPELSQRIGAIKTVGLLPPVLSIYEYQATWLGYDLVPHDDCSPAAADQVTKAFISELAAASSPFVVIGGKEEPDFDEMVELFRPVDFSLQRHAYEEESGEMPPREPFPGKLHFPEYSLGAAQEAMLRKGVDCSLGRQRVQCGADGGCSGKGRDRSSLGHFVRNGQDSRSTKHYDKDRTQRRTGR